MLTPSARSASPEVRNPVLALPSAARFNDLPVEARDALLAFSATCARTPPLAATSRGVSANIVQPHIGKSLRSMPANCRNALRRSMAR